MKGLILIVAMLISTAQADVAYNYKHKFCSINNFTSDTIRWTDLFIVGDYEGVDVVIRANSIDSVKFIVGYQRGYPSSGTIVWERPWVSFDTVDITTEANIKTQDSMFYSASGDTDIVLAVDTSQVSDYTIMIRHIDAFRSPYARFVIKGLSGNSVEPYNVLFDIILPKYYRVDVGTTNQPERQ